MLRECVHEAGLFVCRVSLAFGLLQLLYLKRSILLTPLLILPSDTFYKKESFTKTTRRSNKVLTRADQILQQRTLLRNDEIIATVAAHQLSITLPSAQPYSSSIMQECTVCTIDSPLSKYPDLSHPTHGPGVCEACWQDYLRAQIQTTSVGDISCAECKLTLDELAVKALASKSIYDR